MVLKKFGVKRETEDRNTIALRRRHWVTEESRVDHQPDWDAMALWIRYNAGWVLYFVDDWIVEMLGYLGT